MHMKKAVQALILMGGLFLCFKYFSREKDKLAFTSKQDYPNHENLKAEVEKVKKRFASNSNYNSEIGFFIDMKIPSNKNRFFIYDFKNDSIIDTGLVAHGVGSETGVNGKLQFSNVPNSLSTSLGIYSIGHSYQGKFGKAYKLYGLDDSNSNAFSRHIVLHKFDKVPYEEQSKYICNSHGCPMVNEKFYSRIEKIIDH